MSNIKIGALWRQTSKSNQEYLSGVIDGLKGRGVIRIVVFTNNRKTKDTHPDYQIFRSTLKDERGASRAA